MRELFQACRLCFNMTGIRFSAPAEAGGASITAIWFFTAFCTFSKASQFRKTSSPWKAGEISPVESEQAHSKLSGNQVVRSLATAPINFGGNCINPVVVQIEG